MPKPVIHLEPLAGLCNRLRALVSGICWAEDLGCDLVVHWPPNIPACHASFEILWDIRSLPTGVTVCWDGLTAAKMTLQPEDMTKVVEAWTDREKPLHIRSYGRFHTSDPDRWLNRLRSLRPKPELATELERRLRGVPTSMRIGVHIRRGDNTKSIQASPLDAFVKAMKTYPEYTCFIVATDDEQVAHQLASNFPNRCLFPAALRSRNTDHGMEEAMIDLLGLASCREILGSMHSSFSDIAAQYSQGKLHLVQ